MREIKFRAWNKITKEMLWVSRLDWFINSGCTEKKPSNAYLTDEDDYFGYGKDENKTDYLDVITDDIILMQYTGLKDKNGKEIYEGDITKKYVGEKYIGKGKIVFGHFNLFESYGRPFATMGFSLEWNDESGHCPLDDAREFEIIGNIYENPELLEK